MWRTEHRGAALLVAALLVGAGSGAEARDLIAVGSGGRPWRDGGGGIPPVIIIGATEATNENTPGGVVDFAAREGWMFPESADKTENIALTLAIRGGVVTAPSVLENLTTELPKMVDDNAETAFERKSVAGRPARALGVILQYDLGARFGVSRIRFFPRNAAPDYPAPEFPFQDDFLRAYELFLNDGTKATLSAGLPVFTSVLLQTQNDDPVVDVSIEPQYVRYLQLKSQTTVGFEVAEFQVFGEGYVPTAEYYSDIFDIGEGLAVWGGVRWEEDSVGDPIRSEAGLSTRSGVDDTPVVFHRIRSDGLKVPWREADALPAGSAARQLVTALDAPSLELRDALATYRELSVAERDAVALTQADHRALGAAERGTIHDDLDNWSTWSPPYLGGRVGAAEVQGGAGGVRIVSPGPRRYFQFRVQFTSEELFSAKGLGSLSFDYTGPALAEEVIAEIEPRQAELGESTPFSLVVVPDLRPGVDRGFDALVVSTPVFVQSLRRIAMTLPDGSRREQSFADADLTSLPITRGDFQVDEVADDHFQVSFPAVAASALGTARVTAIEVDFDCVVLRTGTEFTVQTLLEGQDEVPQRAVAGNARALSQGGGSAVLRDPANLAVQVERKGGLLTNVGAEPRVVTPNGDRVNDTTSIRFDITDLTSGAAVEVSIYDLAGRLLRVVDSGSYASGRYTRTWDGTDGHGSPVPPGLYLFTISVDADAGGARTSGTVAVAY